MTIFDFSDYKKDDDEKKPSQVAGDKVKSQIEKKKTEGSTFDFSDYKPPKTVVKTNVQVDIDKPLLEKKKTPEPIYKPNADLMDSARQIETPKVTSYLDMGLDDIQSDLSTKVFQSKAVGDNKNADKYAKRLEKVVEARKPESSVLKRVATWAVEGVKRKLGSAAGGAVGAGATTLLDFAKSVAERAEGGKVPEAPKKIEGELPKPMTSLLNPKQEIKPLIIPIEEEMKKLSKNAPTPLSPKSAIFDAISDPLKQWSKEVSPTNPTFVDALANGAGSMGAYMLLSATTGFGAGSMAIIETMSESGSVYSRNREKGMSVAEASVEADKNFIANLLINYATNKAGGLFEGGEKSIRTVVGSATAEGLQEGFQQLASNITTGEEDISKGVLESMAVGGIIGGVAKVALPGENTTEMTGEQPGASVQEEKPEEPAAPRKREVVKLDSKPEGVDSAIATIRPDGTAGMAVMISPEVQKKGLGTQVVKELETKLVAKGITNVDISAFTESQGFWEKQGYTVAPNAVEKNGAIKMVKTLSAKPAEITVYRGSKGIVEKSTKNYERILTVKTNQSELIQKLAQEGNTAAKTLYDSAPNKEKLDFTIADRIIREAYKTKYDAIQYQNQSPKLKAQGVTYFEIKSGQSFAEQEATAKVYSQQKREAKYAPEAKKVQKSVSKPVVAKKKVLPSSQKRAVAKQFKKVSRRQAVGSISSVRSIEQYIDSRGTKFRTLDESNEIMVVPDKNLTLKFLEHPDVKGKEFTSYSFLANLNKSTSIPLKQVERETVQRILDQYFPNEKKIDMNEFRRLVIGELMPLEAIESSTYASYGSDNVRLGNADTKTYIMNSPYEHGETGHFSSDFTKTISKDQVEIKEIPVQAQNPREKFAVLRKGVQLTEANIAENVLHLALTEKEAQTWIDEHSGDYSGQISIPIGKGLFSHFRTFDIEGNDTYSPPSQQKKITHIAEVQSDSFQHLERIVDDLTKEPAKLAQELVYNETELIRSIGDGDAKSRIDHYKEMIKLAKDQIAKLPPEKRAYAENRAERRMTFNLLEKAVTTEEEVEFKNRLKKLDEAEVELRNAIPKPKQAKQFLDYKNIWHERTIREAINIKAKEGFDLIRIPTPRTIALIEGFVSEDANSMPYEITSGDSDQLSEGDTIEYGGDDFTVVYADNYVIKVAPSDKTHDMSISDYIDEEMQSRWDDSVVYEFKNVQDDFGTVDTAEKAQFVLDKSEVLKKLSEFYRKNDDIKMQENRLADSNVLREAKAALEKFEKERDNYTKLKKLVEGGVATKEGINSITIRDLSFKDKLEEKYGIEHAYWNYFVDFGAKTLPEMEKEVIEKSEKYIDQAERNISMEETRIRMEEARYQGEIKSIRDRSEPSDVELKGIPKIAIDSAKVNRYYGLDYDIQNILEKMAESDPDETLSLDDFEQDWKNNFSQDFDVRDSLEGIYGKDNVFVPDDNTVWYVEDDGHVEEFQQPDEYDQASSVEDFDISTFEGNQRTVLEFYNKQLIPYVQKLRKGNIELITDENENEWYETKVTKEDLMSPTAYRLKEDLAKVGIKITDKQEKAILKLNSKIFGDQNVKIVGQIFANEKALGSYSKQIINILDRQTDPTETFYHEAVHKYLDVFTDRAEYIGILREAQRKYQLDDLGQVEERLAEDFVKYAKTGKTFSGKIKLYFDKIINRIKKYLGNVDKIDALYSDILAGKAKAKRPSNLPIRTTVESRRKSEFKPVTTPSGVKKKSRAYQRTSERIEEEYRADINYNTLNIAEETAKALAFAEKFPDQAIRIAKGLEKAPTGYTETAISIAASEKALENNDLQLFSRLEAARSLRQTRRGQEIVMEKGRVDENSTHHFVAEVLRARLEAVAKTNRLIFDVKRRFGAKVRTPAQEAVDIIDQKAVRLEQRVRKATLAKLESAQEILDRLTCKV